MYWICYVWYENTNFSTTIQKIMAEPTDTVLFIEYAKHFRSPSHSNRDITCLSPSQSAAFWGLYCNIPGNNTRFQDVAFYLYVSGKQNNISNFTFAYI